MRARWVLEVSNPELSTVGQAIVASWWPGKYYLVSTVMLDSASPLSRLTRSIETGKPDAEVEPGPNVYVTQVIACDREGGVKSFEDPLYEKEFSGLTEARGGHRSTVELLAAGRLRLKR